jgi:phosphohistidine phosphatase
MKTLLLMRHAKSSWKRAGLTDWERPLNKRGKRDGPRMGELLWEEDLVPELIVSSDALRARQTAEAVADAAGYEGEVTYLADLYHGTLAEYVDALASIPDQEGVVMVIGHNPDLQDVLEMLSGQMEPMPTGAIAHLKLPIERWSELRDDTEAELLQIWRPREIG